MLDILKKLGIIKADTQYEKEKSFRGLLEWDHSSNPGMIYHTSVLFSLSLWTAPL
jgi:hypothetical protein